jgi:uncharacterized protein
VTIAWHLLSGLVVGLVGGGLSGLLGVSSGGILVPLAALFLGVDQHAAQGVSLLAQVAPTSLGGVQRYRRSGHAVSLRWLIYLSAGFIVGGCVGAYFAGGVSDHALRWTYVGYLVVLWMIVALRARSHSDKSRPDTSLDSPGAIAILVVVGALGGVSSGFLGIGGGLAVTAGLTAGLKAPQHQAQAVSLAVTALPLTLPAALVYIGQGWTPPWLAIAGVVVGLWIGADIGARFATRLPEAKLRGAFLVLIAAMAILMAYKAL